MVIGDHFGGGDHFDGGDHFGGGTGLRSRHKFVGSTKLDLFIYLNQEIYTQF